MFLLQVFTDSIYEDDTFEHDGDGSWPFHHFVEQLIHDMFDPSKSLSLSLSLSLSQYSEALLSCMF